MFNKKLTYISILLFFIGIIFIILGSSFSYSMESFENNLSLKGALNSIKARNEQIVNVKLSFIGDSLIASYKGENYPGNFLDLLEKNDYNYPYKNVKNIFEKDDWTIANGENVFTDNQLSEIEKNHSPAYWYYAPTRFAKVYSSSSIEIVSVMNNHSYDYGGIGYQDTIAALKKEQIVVGTEEPVILKKNNIKIGILCINLFHESQYYECIKDIKKIHSTVDYIIIYFHGGTEYLYKPTDEIVKYSHGFIDNGADLVIGAHPHVLEPIEIYNDKKIVYSLGSFLFGGTKTLINRTIIYQMNLTFNDNKKVINENDQVIPCYLYTGSDGYESWIPSVITSQEEKQKVIDFMNQRIDSPI